MTPERSQQIEQLYHEALEFVEDQRDAFLARACAGDKALQRDVEDLLKAHEKAGGFLDPPAMQLVARQTAPKQSASLAGQTVGHYEVRTLVGSGGMGEVYMAWDRRLDRTVALKILPSDVAADPDRMQRFVREAKAASALNHPNVATIYDIGNADGCNFIAMEYVEGQTLAAKI